MGTVIISRNRYRTSNLRSDHGKMQCFVALDYGIELTYKQNLVDKSQNKTRRPIGSSRFDTHTSQAV